MAVTSQVSVLRKAPMPADVFLAGGDAVGKHVVLVQPLEGAQRGLKLARIARPGIDQGRQADVFVEDDRVAGVNAALAPERGGRWPRSGWAMACSTGRESAGRRCRNRSPAWRPGCTGR